MKLLTLGALISGLAFSFTGCMSTTSMGTVASERKQLMIIPEFAWNKLADRNFNKFEKKAKSKSVYLVDPRLDNIMARLIPYANEYLADHRKQINWKINGNLSSKPNAHSFPSGQIIVNTAVYMFEDLTDDELATLISHEMAHVIRGHSREKASVYAATNLSLMGATLGAGYALGVAGGLTGNYGMTMPHHRHLEEEADLIGLDLMVRAGFDHKATLTFWEKFEANLSKRDTDTKFPSFLSSHPSNQQRKNVLMQNILAIDLLQAKPARYSAQN